MITETVKGTTYRLPLADDERHAEILSAARKVTAKPARLSPRASLLTVPMITPAGSVVTYTDNGETRTGEVWSLAPANGTIWVVTDARRFVCLKRRRGEWIIDQRFVG